MVNFWYAQRAYWELVSRGKNFFAKKRTLGNRLISCSLMTAFGQKRTSSIVMVEQRTENPRVGGSIDSHILVQGLRPACGCPNLLTARDGGNAGFSYGVKS